MTRMQKQLTPETDIQSNHVTVADEVRRTGVPRSTLYQLAASGAIPHFRIGRSLYLYRGALDDYIAKQTEAAMAQFRGNA